MRSVQDIMIILLIFDTKAIRLEERGYPIFIPSASSSIWRRVLMADRTRWVVALIKEAVLFNTIAPLLCRGAVYKRLR